MSLLNKNLFRNAKSKTLNFIYFCSHHLEQCSSFHTSAVQLSFLGMCQFLKKKSKHLIFNIKKCSSFKSEGAPISVQIEEAIKSLASCRGTNRQLRETFRHNLHLTCLD